MVSCVELAEPFARHVRVDLGGRYVAVPEQHLHHPKVGAVIQQVGGEGVAQGMGGDRFGDSGHDRVALDRLPDRLPADRAREAPGK